MEGGGETTKLGGSSEVLPLQKKEGGGAEKNGSHAKAHKVLR